MPANIDPIIIASAPAAKALAMSPENLIPPSEIILISFLFNVFFLNSGMMESNNAGRVGVAA